MRIEFTPVGVSFEDTAPNLELLSVGSEVSFEHRPAFYGTGENRKEYPNAIMILFEGKKVGSVAESSSEESPQQTILRMIKSGINPVGKVIEIITPGESDTFKKTYKLSVDVIELNKEIPTVFNKVSFNEKDVKIVFDSQSHCYFYGDKKLVSATAHKSTFYKKFDSENVAKAASRAWGVDENELKDLWGANGDLASEFGTLVHKILEHYTKFKVLGQKVADVKGQEDNYALPKHPILKSIIEGFIEIEDIEGEIVPEALITNVEKGFCGHADRVIVIDKEKKICDIEDYKININSEEISKDKKPLEPFNELPANKLTEYQIQMSIYANMMQASGWTVNKLVVYVYEEIWKRYELPILKVI
jgi:ribosomal protein L31